MKASQNAEFKPHFLANIKRVKNKNLLIYFTHCVTISYLTPPLPPTSHSSMRMQFTNFE